MYPRDSEICQQKKFATDIKTFIARIQYRVITNTINNINIDKYR